MKIRESKNLIYTKLPFVIGDPERLDPRTCLLQDFKQADDSLFLFFRNGGEVVIRAKNTEGGIEIDHIDAKLGKFLGKSYEEILDEDF